MMLDNALTGYTVFTFLSFILLLGNLGNNNGNMANGKSTAQKAACRVVCSRLAV